MSRRPLPGVPLEKASEPIPFGKYELLERLAIGGMAEVFRARVRGEGGFEKHLVIKRILPHLSSDSEFVVMLIDEAKIAVCLSHPNIVQVYDLGKIEGTYFIAMEFIEGGDLREILRRCAQRHIRIPIHHAIYIATEVLKGLDYAHAKRAGTKDSHVPLQIIHRDISPPNILLSYAGEVKIVDFGIAKASTRMMETAAGILKGKFEYMSPEQASGLAVDARTDLFSTALLLYEMLAGKNPFVAEADIQVLNNVRNAHVLPPSRINPSIPPRLEQIVMKALRLDADKRYLRAGEMGADLLSFAYQSGHISNASKLSRFMAELFAEEIAAGRTASSAAPPPENTRQSLGRLPGSAPGRPAPSPGGDDASPATAPTARPGVLDDADDEGVTEAIQLTDLIQREARRVPRNDTSSRHPVSLQVRSPSRPAQDGDGTSRRTGWRLPSAIPAADGKQTFSFFDNPEVSPDFDATFVPPPSGDDEEEAATTIQQVPQPKPGRPPSPAPLIPVARNIAEPGLDQNAPRHVADREGMSRSSAPETKTEVEIPASTRVADDPESARPTTPIHAVSRQQAVARHSPVETARVDARPDRAAHDPAKPAAAVEPVVQAPMPPPEPRGHSVAPGPGPEPVEDSAPAAERPLPEDPWAHPPAGVSSPLSETEDIVTRLVGTFKQRPAMSAFIGGVVTGFFLANLLGAPFCGSGEEGDLHPGVTPQGMARAMHPGERAEAVPFQPMVPGATIRAVRAIHAGERPGGDADIHVSPAGGAFRTQAVSRTLPASLEYTDSRE